MKDINIDAKRGNAFTRRFFIGGLASLGAFGGCRALRFPAGSCSGGRPNLRFGVVSDVHVRIGPGGFAKNHGPETLESAFRWFRDRGVDAVMIPGDLADMGLVPELEAVAATWFRVFPDDRAPDGRRVERLFVCGNHDWDGWSYSCYKGLYENLFRDEADIQRNKAGLDQKGSWERVFHEPFSLVWRKEVKGYSFVGAHWTGEHCIGSSFADEKGVVGVADFFAKTGPFDPSRPLFYFHHPHLKNTCYGPWAWGHDDGEATRVLSAFPNAVAFSGHSHYTLTDERSIWQGAFTSVGAGSLRFTGMPYYEFSPEGYENSVAPKPRRKEFDPFKAMKTLETGDGRQGLLVSVHDDRIVYERRDMIGGKSLGDDWVQPLESSEPRPFAFAVRAAKSVAPEFPSGAELVVRRERGKTRNGNEADVFAVEFPPANAAKGARALYYKVEIAPKGGEKTVKRMLAPGFHLPADNPQANAKCVFRIAADRLPAASEYAFFTCPVNSLGKIGMSLSKTERTMQ